MKNIGKNYIYINISDTKITLLYTKDQSRFIIYLPTTILIY